MNVSKRFLVLNSKNEAQRPCDHGVHTPGLQNDKSPSFVGEKAAEQAKAFADILAKRNVGQKFYLAEIQAGTVQYTTPATPGDWVVAAADSAE